MESSELLRMVLESVSNDYEQLDGIADEIAKWSETPRDRLDLEKLRVVLTAAIKSGYIEMYDLSPTAPHSVRVPIANGNLDDCWFLITESGKAQLVLDALDQLREMYETKLRKGPFPLADCHAAGLTNAEHAIVTTFLADVTGIASHGHKLASITEPRKTKFKQFVARSFEERWPDTYAKITPERSLTLFRLMKDTDEVRLLIMRYLAAEAHL